MSFSLRSHAATPSGTRIVTAAALDCTATVKLAGILRKADLDHARVGADVELGEPYAPEVETGCAAPCLDAKGRPGPDR